MTKEQEELFNKWYAKVDFSNISDKIKTLESWQACLDANKDKIIDIEWPEWAMQKVEFFIPNFFATIGILKDCLRNDEWSEETISSVILTPRPVEKWQPKEGEWKWVIYLDGEITLDKQEYEFDRTGGIKAFAKLNPENFDAESKMTEADFRNRGDFMEAGE